MSAPRLATGCPIQHAGFFPSTSADEFAHDHRRGAGGRPSPFRTTIGMIQSLSCRTRIKNQSKPEHTGQQLAEYEGHRNGSGCPVAFASNGKMVAWGSHRDKTVKLWDVAKRKEIATLVNGDAGIDSLSFSPDCRVVAVGGTNGDVKLWDVDTASRESELASCHPGRPESIVDQVEGRVM